MRVLLVSTIHFRGSWMEPFKVHATQDREFHAEGASKAVMVPTMMHAGDAFRTMENELDRATQVRARSWPGRAFLAQVAHGEPLEAR